MKHFKLPITIWSVNIRDKSSQVSIHEAFFLFKWQAKRYHSKILTWLDTDNFNAELGGETLFLFNYVS